MSKGTRKIPGNICMDGIDLNPALAHCSGSMRGYESTLRYVVIVAVFLAMSYYGWPFIVAILTLL